MSHKVSVLLVEDNPGDAQLTKIALRESALLRITTWVMDSDELFAHLDESPELLLPGLFLMDLNLPGLSGFEICSLLKKNPRTAAIPIVVLTSSSNKADSVKASEVGAEEYLIKPLNIADFSTMAEVLDAFWEGHCARL